MKKLSMAVGFVVAVSFIGNLAPFHQEVLARDGCCKERKKEKDKWTANGKSYKDCLKANKREKKKDKISKKTGLVWWDEDC